MAKRRAMGEESILSPGSSKFREIIDNPAVRYVAGGIASAILTKVFTKMTDRYPEITRFLKENIDTLEQKLGEFQGQQESTGSRKSGSINAPQ